MTETDKFAGRLAVKLGMGSASYGAGVLAGAITEYGAGLLAALTVERNRVIEASEEIIKLKSELVASRGENEVLRRKVVQAAADNTRLVSELQESL